MLLKGMGPRTAAGDWKRRRGLERDSSRRTWVHVT
jgi:hypothetical protein